MWDYEDMGHLLKGLATWLRVEGKLHDDRLRVCTPLSLLASEIDAQISGYDLENVLYELVCNALKYAKAETPVLLTIERGNGKMTFSVMNEGTGIEEGDMGRIFDTFYRGKHKGVPGSGLGLPVCKRIIEKEMRGRIWAESEPGAGARFCVELPIGRDRERGCQ